MKILIVGAKGMLGQDLAKVFSDWDAVLWDREDIDITDSHMVDVKIKMVEPEVIINAAAYNAVDDCETNVETAVQVNGLGPLHLAQAANNLGIPLVQYSTDYVFDGRNKDGYLENDMPDPISAYGYSKRQGEKNVLENGNHVYLIRTSRLFGAPAASVGAKKSFVDVMLGLAKDREELQVVNEEWSNPTYTPDLARKTREIIDSRLPFGIYHVANEGACTWYDFAKATFELSNIPMKLDAVGTDAFPRPALRPKYSSLINTKLPRMRHWREALADYLKARN